LGYLQGIALVMLLRVFDESLEDINLKNVQTTLAHGLVLPLVAALGEKQHQQSELLQPFVYYWTDHL